jgi:uncharacterized protein YcgI (DUF1989 family)
MGKKIKIPAGHGKATRLATGQSVKLINTSGQQVVDTWALNAYDLAEYMCMTSTRVWNTQLNPNTGDKLVTLKRRPILTIVEDTTPGIHDSFMAACDEYRHYLLELKGYHRNCQDNMAEGLQELDITPPFPIAG